MENGRREPPEHIAHDQRLLAHMRRAPAGQYTAVQLARNTGLPLPEVQSRLAKLVIDGVIVRSTVTVGPAFQLAEKPPTPITRPTPRVAADRLRHLRAS
jgi:DNA-binding Lrp family transcriptional regulator